MSPDNESTFEISIDLFALNTHFSFNCFTYTLSIGVI